MGNNMILKATDLDSFLKDEDKKYLKQVEHYCREATGIFTNTSNTEKETQTVNRMKSLYLF